MEASRRRRISTREALRFLTDAGSALSSSLAYPDTLQTVADLAVPRMACWCVVEVCERDEPSRIATAHVDAEHARLLRRTVGEAEDRRPGPPLREVLRTGEPLLVRRLDEWRERHGDDEGRAALERARRLGTTSWMALPLKSRGRVLGALGLGSTRTDRFYDEDDLALAEEMARLAAQAIENARLYHQAQRAVRARDEVLRVVSHDLRNPLGTIRMAADLMLDPELAAGLDVPRQAALIRRQTERMEHLIRDLLDVARLEAGRLTVEPVPIAPGALLREALDALAPLAEREGLTLRLAEPDQPGGLRALPRVRADAPRVSQVLSNLVGNAIKFTRAGGTITLRAEREDDAVRFAVADTGRGIAPEQLPHLFDRFWQSEQGDRRGIGLGMPIVRGLVEAHGGEVRVRSELGRGTTVEFTLPLAGERTDRPGTAGPAARDTAPHVGLGGNGAP